MLCIALLVCGCARHTLNSPHLSPCPAARVHGRIRQGMGVQDARCEQRHHVELALVAAVA